MRSKEVIHIIYLNPYRNIGVFLYPKIKKGYYFTTPQTTATIITITYTIK